MNSTNYHKAIFFDLDGVVVDTESMYQRIMMEYNRRKGLFISERLYNDHVLGKTQKMISEFLHKEWSNNYNEITYWDGLLEFREDYIKAHGVAIKDGFEELFAFLQKHGFYIGIVTSNSSQFACKLLEYAGIDLKWFNAVIAREHVQRTKPFPDLYEEAVRISGVSRNCIIAIEDSSVGIQAAIDAKINVIHVKDIAEISDELRKKCLIDVESLNEIKSFLSGSNYDRK